MSIITSCQIEDENSPQPIDNFIKYYGEPETSYVLADIEVLYNEMGTVENFFLLGSRIIEDSSDLYLVKTDANGIQISDATFSFYDPSFGNSVDVAKKLKLSGDSLLVLGNTSFRSSTNSLLNGIIWTLLDTELLPILPFPSGNTLDTIVIDTTSAGRGIRGNDIVKTRDGNFVVVGNADDLSSGQEHFRLKLDAANPDVKIWNRPTEPSTVDDLVRVFEKPDGSLVFFGNTTNPGFDDGKGGVNVIWISANEDGGVNGGKSHGITVGTNRNANDVLMDAIEKPGGYAVTGTSNSGGNEFAFVMNMSSLGDLISGDTLTSIFRNGGNPLNTNGAALTRDANNDFIVVGRYVDFRPDNQEIISTSFDRAGEAMFIRTEQDASPVEGFETNYGLESGDDIASAVVTLEDGKIVVGATIDFGGGVTLMSLIKLNDTGRLDEE
ncbi:MAG: hypothetical protein AAF551_02280 [Bacteroidota bacterium]